jgi:hypothetical protein
MQRGNLHVGLAALPLKFEHLVESDQVESTLGADLGAQVIERTAVEDAQEVQE